MRRFLQYLRGKFSKAKPGEKDLDEIKSLLKHYAKRRNCNVKDVQYRVDKYGAVHIRRNP